MKICISFFLLVNSALAFSGSAFDYSDAEFDITDRFGRPRARLLALRDNPDNLTQAQAIAGYSATCGAVNSATGLPEVQADINNVTVNSLAIAAEFRTILVQLTGIDNRNLTAQKFAPAWSVLSSQWTDILWASRNTASDTVAYTQNFIDTIMPFVANTTGTNVPPVLGVQVLQAYIQQAQGLKNNAQLTSQNFTNLQDSLALFAESFKDFAVNEHVAASNQLDTLKSEVAGLDVQIQTLTNQIILIGIALGISIFAEVGLLALLPVSGPFFILVGIAAVLNAGAIIAESVLLATWIKERSSLQSERNNDLSQIAQLQNTLTQIANANQTLNSIGSETIPTMIVQLQAFNGIWDAVVGDCEAGIQYLNQLTEPINQLIPQLFWTTANHIPCLYEVLIPALNKYAAGISSGGLPPPSVAVPPPALDHVQFRAQVKAMVGNAMLKAAALSDLEL